MATTGKRGRPTKDEAQKANLRVSFDLTPDEYLQFESFFSEYRKQKPSGLLSVDASIRFQLGAA